MDFVIPLPGIRRGNTELLLFQDLFYGICDCESHERDVSTKGSEIVKNIIFRPFGASILNRHDRDICGKEDRQVCGNTVST